MPEGTWLARMLAPKLWMLIAVVLALGNGMAWAIWAMLSEGENNRNPVAAV